jgi:molybdate-binding protein
VVGADFSEGQENTISVGDYHAIHVIDHVRKVQVAEHLSRADLSKLPLWVVLIGLYFNEAWLAPERNGPGIYVVEALKDYRYRMIYRPRSRGSMTIF